MAVNSMDLSDLRGRECLDAIVYFMNIHHPGLFHTIETEQGDSPDWLKGYALRYGEDQLVLDLTVSQGFNTSAFTIRCGYSGGSDSYSSRGGTEKGPKRIYSTSNGIMMTWQNTNERSPKRISFIVSDEPDYGLILHGMGMTVTTTGSGASATFNVTASTEGVCDTVNGSDKEVCCGYETITSYKYLDEICRESTKTMLIPLILDSGYVTQNIFRQVYSESPGTEGVFTLGGNTFVSNGYFALKD